MAETAACTSLQASAFPTSVLPKHLEKMMAATQAHHRSKRRRSATTGTRPPALGDSVCSPHALIAARGRTGPTWRPAGAHPGLCAPCSSGGLRLQSLPRKPQGWPSGDGTQAVITVSTARLRHCLPNCRRDKGRFGGFHFPTNTIAKWTLLCSKAPNKHPHVITGMRAFTE